MLKSWEGYAKTGCTSCTNWTISFEVWGFRTKTRLLERDFIFLKHILTQDFFCIQYAPFRATSLLFNRFLTSFAIFHAFHDLFWVTTMTLKLKSTANELWNGWKLASYHSFTNIACAKKFRGLRENLDALLVQTGQSPSKFQVFGWKHVYYKGISFF